MSRHGTPSSAVGRLDLHGSYSSSPSGMPVETRSARKRAGNQSVRYAAASSGTSRTPPVTPGPSRLAGTGGRSGQSSRRGGKQPASASGASKRPVPDDDDGDDDDGDGEGDSSGDDDGDDNVNNWRQSKLGVVLEVFSLYTHNFLTPLEFFALPPNASGDNDERLRHIVPLVTASITSQADLNRYRNTWQRGYCVQQIIDRMWQRRQTIRDRLQLYITTRSTGSNMPRTGSDVPRTIDDYRRLFQAIERLIERYENVLTDAQNQALVNILYHVLYYSISAMDRDVYADNNAPGPSYAGQSSGNPWHSFCHKDQQPGIFVHVLMALPRALLRNHEWRTLLAWMYRRLDEGGDGNQQWVQRLRQLWVSLSTPEA